MAYCIATITVTCVCYRNAIMNECWKFDAERRPSWVDLKQAIADKKKEYCDLNAYEQIHFG